MGSANRGGAVVLLSGPVGSGKTTLAEALVNKLGFTRLFTRDLILRRLPQTPRTRVDLQAAGEQLDRETRGQWVAEELAKLRSEGHAADGLLVDAVLIPQQVEAVRRAAQGQVVHVHLTAPMHELEARYAKKRSGIEESSSYSALLKSATEAKVNELGKQADLVFDTAEATLAHEVAEVVRRLDPAPS